MRTKISEFGNIAHARSRVGTGWGFAVMLLGMLAIMAPFVSGVAVTATNYGDSSLKSN